MVAAQETTLKEILEGSKQYLVPLYQRPYQWSVKQLDALWKDIIELVDDRREGERDSHFIGSLVLAPPPIAEPTGVNTFLVIDGQQRLTTLSILLAALRDYLKTHGESGDAEESAAEIHESYLVNRFKKGEKYFKLVPTQADREAFHSIILEKDSRGGEDKIGEAYRFFSTKLEEFDDPDDPNDVRELQDAVILGLSLVSIATGANDNAHRIFQSLNNTGLSLTQGDLIRNYIFMRLPHTGEEVYEKYWCQIQDQLENDEIENLFWIDLAKEFPRAKIGDTFVYQQRRFDRLEDETAVANEVVRLVELAKLYKIVLHPEIEKDPEIRRGLQHLKDWDLTVAQPLLLELLHRRAMGIATSEEVSESIRTIESYVIRRFLSGRPTQGLNRIFRDALVAATNQTQLHKWLPEWFGQGRRHFVANDALRQAIKTNSYFLTGRSAHRKLFLCWLEEQFESKEPVLTDKLTIEHVLPQPQTAEWLEDLGADQSDDAFVERYESLLHTLGNLTLTGYNSELSNSRFARKKIELSKSGVRLSSSIVETDAWSLDSIEQRSDYLADVILNAWPGPETSRGLKEESLTLKRVRQLMKAFPSGRWTTYGDIAVVVGSGAQVIGNYLTNEPILGAYRVLNRSGKVAPGFKWTIEGETRTPQEVLESEGVSFDTKGRALPELRMHADELAKLVNFEDLI